MKTRLIYILLLINLFLITSAVQGATGLQSGFIKGNNVNLREEPGLDGEIITLLQQGTLITIEEQSDDWFKVELPDGQTGWIYQQFVEVASQAPDDYGKGFTGLQEILAYARSLLGTTYAYGGASLRGFDCSGFTMYVFAKFGINLPHEADQQMDIGDKVPVMEDLLPGDLVFFKTLGSSIVNHVGIYLGDNRFIHASSGIGTVHISPLDSGYYYDRYVGGRRLQNSQALNTAG